MIIGGVKKLDLSFLTPPSPWSRRLNTAVLPSRNANGENTKTRVGKTDQDCIKNAGSMTGIFEGLLKTSSYLTAPFVCVSELFFNGCRSGWSDHVKRHIGEEQLAVIEIKYYI